MRAESTSFIGADGIPIHLASWLPDDAVQAVAVVAHGFGEHGGRYSNVADALVSDGFAIYAPDHRGHGRSGGTRALIDRHEYILDDLDHVFGVVAAAHAGLPVFLIGHSMGGNIALASALRRQDHLSGLVLSGALVTNDGIPKVLTVLAPLLGKLFPKLGTKQLDASFVSSDPAVVQAYQADPLVHHGKVPAGTAAALVTSAASFQARFGSLSVPLLVVHGGEDRLVPVSAGKTVHAKAGSVDKTIHIYEGFAHEVFNEPGRSRVLSDVRSWLNAHRSIANEAAAN